MDAKLLLFFNSYHNVWLDSFMWDASQTRTWILMLVALLYVIFKNNQWKQAFIIVASVAMCILLADQLSSHLIKPWVCRLRPTHNPEIMHLVHTVRDYRSGLYGFCSSHAANSFAVATFLSMLFRRKQTTIILFTWCSLTSFSRIYLGVHYPGDIVCGALLGVVIALVVFAIYKRIVNTIQPSVNYYSSAYTSTGYLNDDLVIFSLASLITLLGMFLHVG